MLRPKLLVVFSSSGVPLRKISSPWSAPKKTTSMAPGLICAELRICAREAPAHFALPTALVRKGSPLFPEHSMVLVTSLRGRAFKSLSVNVNGFATRPVTSSRQFLSSSVGTL